MGSRFKKFCFGALAAGLSLAAFLVLLEIVAIAVLTLRDHRFIPARERFRHHENTFLDTLTRTAEDCRYIDTLFPHPYLAFVHHANPPCGLPYINNIGLFGTDFPLEKMTDRFVVLVTGGSVAAQFAQLLPSGPRYLERILNERYRSPKGHPFLVLNGADGAWKQPQQLILFELYADVVDAVVTLDGFNEANAIGAPLRFEYPANNFLDVNPLAAEDFSSVLWDWAVGRAVGLTRRSAVLSRSHAAYLLLRTLSRSSGAPNTSAHRRTSLHTLFALPQGWDEQKRIAWAIEQYKKDILTMDAVAHSRGVLAAHFIQPVPAIDKKLTARERAVVGDLGYREKYQRMAASLVQLRDQGVEIRSLLDVFAGYDGTLYADPIHLEWDAQGESTGYRMLAEEMSKSLARAWQLQSR